MEPKRQGGVGETRILELGDGRWRRFVESRPDALAFHHPAWATLLSDCYGLDGFVVAFLDDEGQIWGGLPMLEKRALLGARRWISLPFTDHCPALSPPDISDHVLASALDDARRAADIGRLETRGRLESEQTHAISAGVLHTLRLQSDPDAVFRSFSRSQVQRAIRKAEREEVSVARADRSADLDDVFYRLHMRTRRRQGVPVQPRRFFRLLWERVIEPGLGFVLVARRGGEPVAAAVYLAWNGEVTYKFGASDRSALALRPNHLVMWEAIRWACESGFERFDFGRTDEDNEGLRRYKDGWGATESPLVYSALGSRPAASRSGAGGIAGAALRRSPVWVTRATGELLYKHAA